MFDQTIYWNKPRYDAHVQGFGVKTRLKGYKPHKRKLFEHILATAKRINTPYGSLPYLFLDYRDGLYHLCTWPHGHKKAQVIETYTAKTEAENELFQRLFWGDFVKKNDFESCWYETGDQAYEAIARRIMRLWNISAETAASILHKQKMVDFCQQPASSKLDFSAYEADALAYINLIPPEIEPYARTCHRFANALNRPIDQKKFHMIVKIIRSKWKTQKSALKTQKTP